MNRRAFMKALGMGTVGAFLGGLPKAIGERWHGGFDSLPGAIGQTIYVEPNGAARTITLPALDDGVWAFTLVMQSLDGKAWVMPLGVP